MLKPYNKKNSYANRPLTPLGQASGLTSTPVSTAPTRQNSPPPVDPYKYQPAMTWTHPSAFPCPSSNYIQASADIKRTTTSILHAIEKSTVPVPRLDSSIAGDIKEPSDEKFEKIMKAKEGQDEETAV
jgi:hypothetical protein